MARVDNIAKAEQYSLALSASLTILFLPSPLVCSSSREAHSKQLAADGFLVSESASSPTSSSGATGRNGIIYALHDPRTGAAMYVGQTVMSPSRRLSNHCLYPTSIGMTRWVTELKAAGLKLELRVLETCAREMLDEMEIQWIAKFKRRGADLLNVMPGGGSLAAHNERWEIAMKVGLKRRESNPEFKKARVEQMRRRNADPKYKAINDERVRRMHADPKTKLAHAEVMQKMWAKPGAKAAQSERSRRNWADPAFRALQIKKAINHGSDPAVKAARSERARRQWAVPGAKEIQAGKVKQRWADPTSRNAVVDNMRKAWAKNHSHQPNQ